MGKKNSALKTTVDFKDLDECIEICKNMAADNGYKLKRAKSPASKRQANANVRFWGSTAYYLGLVEAMTDDEVLQLEERIKSKEGGQGA